MKTGTDAELYTLRRGGAGAIESLQDAGGESIEQAKKTAGKAKSGIDRIFGKVI